MFFRKRKRKCPASWTNSFKSLSESNSNSNSNSKAAINSKSLFLMLLLICGFQVALSQVLEFKSNNNFSDFKLKNKAHHWTGRSARQFLANNPTARQQKLVSTSTTRLFAVAGQSVELQCPLANELLASSSNRSIVWRKDKTLLNNQLNARQRINALNGSLVIVDAQVELDEGQFECSLVEQQAAEVGDKLDSAGKAIKAHKFELKLLVKPRLAPFEFAANAQVGMKVVLTCAALEGQQPMSFVWLKDNQLISGDGAQLIAAAELPSATGNGRQANSLSQLHQQQLADKLALMESREADEYALIGQEEPPDQDILLPVLSDSNVRTRQADDYSILSIEKLELKHAGTYTCSAQNEAARASHSSQLVINAPPMLIVEPQSADLVSGQSRLFECAASGQPKPAISWFRARESEASKMFDYVPLYDNLRYTTLSNGSLAIANVTKREQGFYLCSAKNGFGPETTKLIRVTVHEPPKFSPKFKTLEVRIEERANMLCAASGEAPLTIDWLDKDGKPIQESDKKFIIENEPKLSELDAVQPTSKDLEAPSANLSLSRLMLARSGRLDSGHYTCIASNKHGKDKMVTNLLVQDVPDKVSELKVTNVTASTISLRWQVGFSGNSPISSYLIQYQSDDPLDELLMAPALLQQPQSQQEQQRPGASLAAISLQAAPTAISLAPDAPTLDALNVALATLESPEEAIDRTLVELTVEQSASNLVVKDLSPYCAYRLRLAAINKIGLSEFTDWMRAKTEEAAPGGVALKIGAAATGPNSIKLSWMPPDRRTWNGQLTGFSILYRPLDSSFELNKTLEWAAPSVQSIMADVERQRQLAASAATSGNKSAPDEGRRVGARKETNAALREHLRRLLALQQQELVAHLTNLQRSTTYLVWIQAINNKGFGPQSAPISVRTLEDVPPSAPLLKVQSSSESSVTIAWSMPTNFLSPANQYSLFYRKLAASSANLSAPSDTGSADYLAPQQPQEVGPFVERTISSQQLLAVMSSSNPASQSFDQKSFVHNQQHQHQQLVYTLDQLDCGSAYELYMITRNSVGKSEPSALISTRTVGEAPIAPASKQTLFAKIAPTEVNLNLAAWSSGGCPLTHITLRYKPTPTGNSSISWPISTSVPSSLLISLNKQLSGSEQHFSGAKSLDWPAQALFTLKNLSPSTNYELQMIAYNSAGHTLSQFEFASANPNGSRPNFGRREGGGVFRAVDVFAVSGGASVEPQAAFANQSGASGQLIPLVLMLLCLVCLIISSSFCYYRIRDSWKHQRQSRPARGSANCEQSARRSPTAGSQAPVGKSGSMWRDFNQHQLHSALKQSQEASILQELAESANYCDPTTNQLSSKLSHSKEPAGFNQSVSMRDFNLVTNPRAASSTLNLTKHQQRKSSFQSEQPKTSTLHRATMLADSYANYGTNQLCSSAFCMDPKQPDICANLAAIHANGSGQYSENQCANYANDNEQQETSWTTNYAQFGEATKATYAVPAQTYGQLYQTGKQVSEYQAENGYGEIDHCIQRLVEQQYQQQQHCHQQQQYAMIMNMKPDQQQQNRCIYGPNEAFASGQLQVIPSSELQGKTSGQQSVMDSSSSSSGIDLGAHIDCASSATGTSNSNASQDAYPQQICELSDFRSAAKAHFQQSHLQCVNEIDLKQS